MTFVSFLLSPLAFAHGHFPLCPKRTSDAQVAKDMLYVVTEFEADFSKTLVGQVIGKEATLKFGAEAGQLVFDYQRNNRIIGKATMCQKGNELWVTSDSPKFGIETYVLKKSSRTSIKVRKPGVPVSVTFKFR